MKYSALLLLPFVLMACQPKKDAAKKNQPTTAEEKLKQNPSFDNYISYGLFLAGKNQHKESLEAYQKAAEINPKAPVAWNNICFAQIQLNRPLQAVESCKKSLELEPNFVLAQNNLKLAKEKAYLVRDGLIKNQNPNTDEVIDTGMSLYLVKDYDAAIALWNRIKPENKKYSIAQNNIASASILAGKLDQASQALQQALKIEPNNELYLRNKKWLEEEKAKKK